MLIKLNSRLIFLIKKNVFVVLVLMVIMAGGVAVTAVTATSLTVSFLGRSTKTAQAGNGLGAFELSKIKSAATEKEGAAWYRKLIDKVGPGVAQDRLNQIGRYTGPMHLVNHTVGNYLFDKYGAKGIVYCKEYFSGSCYHGLLLNFMGTPQQDSQIAEALSFCREKGGDVTKACIHAIGHGILAQQGYKKLPAAIEECNRTARVQPSLVVIDCQDGVFMENVFGVHDGKPSPDRWVKEDDLTYPCSDQLFSNYLQACWRNQVARIREKTGNDFPKIQNYCDKLAKDIRFTCYTGIYRLVSSKTKNVLDVAAKECDTLKSDLGGDFCVMNVAAYAFFQGDRVILLNYCNQLTGPVVSSCFKNLVGLMKIRIKADEQSDYCDQIEPDEWRLYCQAQRSGF